LGWVYFNGLIKYLNFNISNRLLWVLFGEADLLFTKFYRIAYLSLAGCNESVNGSLNLKSNEKAIHVSPSCLRYRLDGIFYAVIVNFQFAVVGTQPTHIIMWVKGLLNSLNFVAAKYHSCCSNKSKTRC
jgi:hypothetical protein